MLPDALFNQLNSMAMICYRPDWDGRDLDMGDALVRLSEERDLDQVRHELQLIHAYVAAPWLVQRLDAAIALCVPDVWRPVVGPVQAIIEIDGVCGNASMTLDGRIVGPLEVTLSQHEPLTTNLEVTHPQWTCTIIGTMSVNTLVRSQHYNYKIHVDGLITAIELKPFRTGLEP